MKEPKRWLEDPAAPERIHTLLAAAAPPPKLTATIDARLQAAAHGMPSQTALLAQMPAALGAKIIGGLLIAGVATWGISSMYPSASEPTREASREAGAAQPGALPKSAEQRMTPRQPATTSPEPTEHENARNTEPNAAPVRGEPELEGPARSRPEPSRQGSLSEEAALLARAREQVAGDPARALVLSKQHQTQFPEPSLAAERDVIAVESLLRLGRRHEAEARAHALIDSAPNSIYARRLERLLAAGSGP